jgi:hypothetical protein
VKSVFLGGSRKVSRLNDQIRAKLSDLVERKFHILVGDANGADRAMQSLLHSWQYPCVTVFFVGSGPRNNEGHWPTECINPPAGARGADYYAAKDVVMAQRADAGLMLWDGESRGTLSNVKNLIRQAKPVSVYFSKQRRFKNVLTETDLQAALEGSPVPSAESFQPELNLGTSPKSRPTRRKRAV